MFRGTTPKLEFIFDYNLEELNIEEFYITIKQGNKLISEKQLKDITISKNKAIIKLTQSETLTMKETYNVLMQARLKVNGEAYATDIVSVGVASILKDGTIPGGSVDPDNPDNPGCDCGTIDYNDLKNKPTKLSDFINDGVFITNTVNDLINYYTKSQTYTKEEINNLVSVIPKFDIDVVSELPTENISSTTIYLLPSNSSANDMYKEYIYVNNNWELLGIQKIDLTDYYNKTEINTLLSSKVNTSDLATETTNGLMSSTDKAKLNGIASGANVNVQSDWNQTDTSKDDFIKNKPTIPTQLSDLSGTLPISQGGTGATTAEDALTNIGAAASSHTHPASDITSGTLPIERGGTGATTASSAIINLGISGNVLYSNSSGSDGTITLSSSVSNFTRIGVYAKNRLGTVGAYNEIYRPYTTTMLISNIDATNNNYDCTIWRSCLIEFSEKTLTFSRNFASSYYNGTYNSNSSDGFKILRVVGYNY